jgi:hypothetical protein
MPRTEIANTQSRLCARAIIAALLSGCLLSVGVNNRTEAATGSVIQLPRPRTNTPNGVALDVDAIWLDGTGYRPVRCTIHNWPPGPATQDRQFRIVLEPLLSEYGFDPEVEATAILKRGQTSVAIEVYCPQSNWWSSLDVKMYEGSKHLREFDSSIAINQRNMNSWSEAFPSVLFVSSAANRTLTQMQGQHEFPSWHQLCFAIPTYSAFDAAAGGGTAIAAANGEFGIVPPTNNAPTNNAPTNNAPTNNAAANNAARIKDDQYNQVTMNAESKAAQLPLEKLPNRWLGLTSVDLLFITVDDLFVLKKKHPQKFEAVREWTSVGGHLCVSGVGEGAERLTAVETALKLDLTSEDDRTPHWTALSAADYTSEFREGINAANILNRGSQKPIRFAQPTGQPNTPPLVRTVGFGRVFVVANSAQWEDPEFVPWILNSIPASRLAWHQRHGMSMHRYNQSFWNWSIKGVGQVPFLLFLGVISLFALVIGPVNFVTVMRKLKRNYLVLITVPLISLVTTVGLFSYGFLRDGIGTTVRRRAFVELDQRLGHMQSWSRQTYYAGMAPGGGPKFPLNAAVHPLELNPITGTSENPKTLAWGGSQRLARGYITSRTLSQFMIIHPTQSTAANLNIGQKGGVLTVENELGGPIQELVVWGKDGVLYVGKNIDEGASTTLVKAELLWVANFRSAMMAQILAPDVSAGLAPSRGYRGGNYMGDFVDQGLAAPNDETSLLESRLARVSFNAEKELAPGEYIAIMPQSTLVPLGIAHAKDEDSLIVVKGRW